MELVFFVWSDVIKDYSSIESLAMVKVDVGSDIEEMSEVRLLYKYKKQVLASHKHQRQKPFNKCLCEASRYEENR